MTDETTEPEYDEQGRLLLDPIIYDIELDAHGRRIGYRVPDSEREAWDALAEQHHNHTGIYGKAPNVRAQTTARPIDTLIEELDPWIEDFSSGLEQDMRDAYNTDPIRVTKITNSIIKGCQAQRIHTPGGILRTKLADMRNTSAA